MAKYNDTWKRMKFKPFDEPELFVVRCNCYGCNDPRNCRVHGTNADYYRKLVKAGKARYR